MKSGHTDINVILDRSGSMESTRDDAIGGFNTFLKSQQEAPGTASMSVFQFDTIYETVYAGKPVADAPMLSRETFEPRGGTALLDAIGRTIQETGERLAALSDGDRPEKVLVVIVTDGGENSSHHFDHRRIAEMIEHQRDTYKWMFVFIGANQDAIATAAAMNIPASNALNYASTAAGNRKMAQALSASTTSYRSASGSSTTDFFAPDDDISAEKTKTA